MRWGIVRLFAGMMMAGALAAAAQGPVHLQVNNLTTPLGIGNGSVSFSWQLDDATPGARQTAYRVEVATSEAALREGHADVWDSTRVAGDRALNVGLRGKHGVLPGTRYYWRVTAWGADGKPYPPSATTWWETGTAGWADHDARWICYETAEEIAMRRGGSPWVASPASTLLPAEGTADQHFAFRATVTLTKPVRQAALYATGQDTVSAWVNGKQAAAAQPFPPYGQMPWKKFLRTDVTALLTQGANTLALEQIRYRRGSKDAPDLQPAAATLAVVYADGSTQTFYTNATWKTSGAPAAHWQEPGFDDAGWAAAVLWKPGPDAAPMIPWIPDSVKAMRHEFNVTKAVRSARLYATAVGAYRFELNGKPVSQDVLAPGWSDYRDHVYYQTYDVTALLAQGANAIGALLAPGWYSTPLEWFQQPYNYGMVPPTLSAQMRIEYTDGSVDWVVTGEDWKARASEIVSSEIYNGETVDARRIEAGWSRAGFDDRGWQPVLRTMPAYGKILPQEFPPIRVEREVRAVKISQPKPGVYIYDFGQNLAGVERLRLTRTKGKGGAEVRIRFGEILNDDGTLYTDNLRTAKATDRFILAGRGVEEFTPRFTFHGYRYAEITGLPARIKPNQETLTALVLHTDAAFTDSLATGSPLVNQLWSIIQWGQRSNFVGVPTDCPQRDERLGWAADAQVFWRAATYNMDLAAFSRKYATDLRGTQARTPYYGIYAPGTARPNMGHGAGWSDAGIVIPWTAWLQTGDTSVIWENWLAMKKYVDAIEKANPDHLWKNDAGIAFGDWLSPEGTTQYGLIATAYWAYDAELMRQMMHADHHYEDEQRYAAMFEKIRAAFEKEYVRADGLVLGAEKGAGEEDTQTGYVLALHMNLLPEELRAAAAKKLVAKIEANHGLLGTGFLGTPYLLEELTKTGHADVAYQLLLNTQYPSWGYLLEHGATTMWERWNGDQMKDQPGMNSYNHYAYGAVADWIARYAAGVDATPLNAGFHTVVLQPHFDARLGSLDFTYASSYGKIHSAWTVKGKTAEWHITLPANTTGRLALEESEVARWLLDGVPLAMSPLVKKKAPREFDLAAGSYTLTVALP